MADSGSVQRILRRQGRKSLRFWLEQDEKRLEEFGRSLQARDLRGAIALLHEAPDSQYKSLLLQSAQDTDDWFREVSSVLGQHVTTEIHGAIKKGEFFFRPIEVSPTLMRSSQPKRKHLEELRGRLDGVVNLRDESEQSQELCEALGLSYLYLPVVDHEVPSHAQMEEFLALCRSPKRCLVHCFAGRGRTGLFVACYRIAVLGLTPAEAVSCTEREVPGMRANQIEWIMSFQPTA